MNKLSTGGFGLYNCPFLSVGSASEDGKYLGKKSIKFQKAKLKFAAQLFIGMFIILGLISNLVCVS